MRRVSVDRKRTSRGRAADEPQGERPRVDGGALEDSKRSARGCVGLTNMGRGVRGDGERDAAAGTLGNRGADPVVSFIGGLGSVGPHDIFVDSGAEESVWPKNWLPEIPTETAGAALKQFAAANGQETGHYGRTVVKVRRGGCPDVVGLGFEVTDVARPLVAVRRIIEKGNDGVFERGEGTIVNRARGPEIPLERRGGLCVLRGDFLVELEGFVGQV